jgi:LacI family transcriptional regulator
MSTSATLREVAEMAGVSIGTASQALNNRPNVSPETRSRVVDAAKSLGYPVKEVGGMYETSLSVIGMVTKHDYGLQEDIVVNPFYSYVQLGVEGECRRRGISLMMSSIEVDQQNRPIVWPPMLTEQRIDGLLLIGTFIEDTIDMIHQRLNVPIVLVDGYAPHLELDSIVIDNFQGGKMAVEYLINCGHKHIGLIGSSEKSPPGVLKRRYSYLSTLRRHGIEDVYLWDTFMSREKAYQATREMLQQHPMISAIFGINDDVAIGAINAAHDMGLKVPGDLSVIGFDNIDLSKEIYPSLTTIHVYKSWMGVLGVRALMERSQNPDQPKTTNVVSTRLLVRDSVRVLSGKKQEAVGGIAEREEVVEAVELITNP